MKKSVNFEIDFPPFSRFKVLVYIGGTDGEFIDFCKIKFKKNFAAPYAEGSQYTIDFKNKTYLIIYMPKLNKSLPSLGTLMHEIQHAVFSAFRQIDIKVASASEEAVTYQCKYLFLEICNKYFGVKDGKQKRQSKSSK